MLWTASVTNHSMLPRTYRNDSETIDTRRKRQIDTLKIFNDHVTELQEDVEYQVDFISGGNNMAILVTLTKEFPLENPILNIRPIVIHPWVNKQGEITNAPGLLNFTVHSDLGRVVQAVIREFERKPPPLYSESSSSGPSKNMTVSQPISNGITSPTYGLPAFTSSISSYPDNTQHQQQQQQQLQQYSVAFPELSKLTIEELTNLNENEDRLSSFIDDFPLTKKMNKALEDLMTQNEELAKSNLTKQPKMEKLIFQVTERQNRLLIHKRTYECASQEYQRLSDRYSPESIKESLRLAALQCDEESEKIAEKFLNKELNVDTFLERYTERRMLSHIRKTKEEKLSNQLKELHRAGY